MECMKAKIAGIEYISKEMPCEYPDMTWLPTDFFVRIKRMMQKIICGSHAFYPKGYLLSGGHETGASKPGLNA